MPTPLITRLTQRLFGAPLLRYSIRGEWVGEMVALALEPGWALCANDRGACDLWQVGGTRARHRPRRRRPSIRRATPHPVTPDLTRGPPSFATPPLRHPGPDPGSTSFAPSRLRVKPRRGEANPRRQIGRQSRSPAASSLPAAPRRAEIIFLQHAIRGIIRAQTMAGRAVHSARRRACKDFRKNRRFPPLRGQKHA